MAKMIGVSNDNYVHLNKMAQENNTTMGGALTEIISSYQSNSALEEREWVGVTPYSVLKSYLELDKQKKAMVLAAIEEIGFDPWNVDRILERVKARS